MRVYETIFILADRVDDTQVQEKIDKYKGIIESNGGDIITIDNWGKRTLAYEIQKNRRGTYVLVKFQGDGTIIKELEKTYRLDEDVIRFMTVKVEQSKSKKQKKTSGGSEK